MHFLIISTLFLYLAALSVGLASLVWKRGGTKMHLLFKLGLVSHLFSLVALSQYQQGDIFYSRGDYLFILSLFVGLAYTTLVKTRSAIVELCVVGVVSVLFVSSSVVSHNAPAHETPSIVVILFHILPALIGEGALCLLAIVSAVYLWKERGLRALNPTMLNADAPSLDALGKVMDKSVRYGFLALGLSVTAGILWAWWESKPLISFDITKLSGLLIWVILGGMIVSREALFLPRRKVALSALIAGILFCGALLINMLVRQQGIHG